MAAPVPVLRPAAVTTARRGTRGKVAGSALGGFTVGLIAVSVGLLLSSSGGDHSPQSAAAETAARAAATRLAVDPAARPSAAPISSVPAQRFSATTDLTMTPQTATRLVVRSVGIDAHVQPVGYLYQDGKLQYDVPRAEAGEYVSSAQVGRPGNAIIGGHISLRGLPGVFAKLPGVVAGDVVEVYRGDQIFRYSVTEIRIVAPDATSVMSQTQDATLTLITCFPGDNFQDRLVVRGKLL